MTQSSLPITVLFSTLSEPRGLPTEQLDIATLEARVAEHSGELVKRLTDGVMAVFRAPANAVSCAIAMRADAREDRSYSYELRIGFALGEAFTEKEDYFGTPVVIARRLCDAAEAGQILCNSLLTRFKTVRHSAEFKSLGLKELAGLDEPISVSEVLEAPATEQELGLGQMRREAERRGGGKAPAAVGVSGAGRTVVTESGGKSFAHGRYVARRLLGQGAQKNVYLVDDTTLNRECAISVLNPALLDRGDIDRIKQEAQTMAQFGSHPNIVTIYDYGEEEGAPYVVSEYVSGGELRDELRRANGPVPIDRAVALAADLCQALSFAHEHDIVHRDLKPENVWLARDGTAKLGDFGIALAAGRTRLTMPGGASGTPLYMAPEQASGGKIGPATDLYALGALLYELVAGRTPFTGDDPNAIIYQHVHNDPDPPSTLNEAVPEELDALILKLLAKRQNERFESADDVLEELGRVAGIGRRSPTR